MIKRIDIKKFGQFKNYQWGTLIGKDQEFKKLNIIYGRNYSGKTTLSRIFRCIEKGELHRHYLDGDFQFTLHDSSSITQHNIETYATLIKVRVYNSDFVHENLSWLHNIDGTINPFTILGDINVEIDKKLKEIAQGLGSIESGVGVLYELDAARTAVAQKNKEYEQKRDEIIEFLKNKAAEIKKNTALFDIPVYTSTHLKRDLDTVTDEHILTEEVADQLKKLLKEEKKNDLKKFVEAKPHYAGAYLAVKELVEKVIRVSQPIQELLADKLLQEWVRRGMDLHRNQKDICGFCGNTLPAGLWDMLDAHFVKESEDLRKAIDTQIEELNNAKESLDNFFRLKKEDVYTKFVQRFETLAVRWREASEQYRANIDTLITELRARRDDIFTARPAPPISDNSDELFELIKDLNIFIEENNSCTRTLAEDQLNARTRLRLSAVARFQKIINYGKLLQEEERLRLAEEEVQKEVSKWEGEERRLLLQKRLFEAQVQDESRGAELVNQYLTHFFGHQELKLIAIDEGAKVHFKVRRDNIDANNLSEGECSLISFCYFIAKIQDELENDPDNLYIYIDDPISSLDSNHTFFIYSLIESVIAKEKKYKQLFISTHSLDFLKYIKTLTDASKGSYFLMQKRARGFTTLIKAPAYLKDYITEFNYLFSEIYACASDTEQTGSEKHLYGFANNMRKFLESYLYFKYPSNDISFAKKINRFFDDDPLTYNLVNRLVNEYSHLKEQFDRGITPLDVPEMQKIAQALMQKLKKTDPDQYESLCISVGVSSTLLGTSDTAVV